MSAAAVIEQTPPPHNAGAEARLLAKLMSAGEKIAGILRASGLSAGVFYVSAHRAMFAGVARCAERGLSPADPRVLWEVLTDDERRSVGEFGRVVETWGADPSVTGWQDVARIVLDKARIRRVMEVAWRVALEAAAADDAGAYATGAAKAVADAASDGVAGLEIEALGDVVNDLFADLDRVQSVRHVPFGIRTLDERFGGFPMGVTSVVAAATGQGKSTFVAQMVFNAASAGVGVLVVALEDANKVWAARGIEQDSGVAAQRLLYGTSQDVGRAEWPDLAMAGSRLTNLPVWFDKRRVGRADRILGLIYGTKAVHQNLGMVVLDYVQLLRVADAGQRRLKRYAEIEEIMRSLHEAAADLGVAMVIVSQLNREGEKGGDGMPRLSNLRDSGAIENMARLVLMLWRPERYGQDSIRLDDDQGGRSVAAKGRTVVIAGKITHGGGVGHRVLDFDAKRRRFTDMQPEAYVPPAAAREEPPPYTDADFKTHWQETHEA